MKSFIRTLGVVIVLMILGGAAFVWSGLYNVAANEPHWGVTFWVLDQAKERSISVHSAKISLPSLKGQKMVDVGLPYFQSSCRLCHGAPGYRRDDFALGLYPIPPILTSNEVKGEMSDAEIYWVVKNGLKMTGMPSFGVTCSKKDLFGIVAFLRVLPTLTPEAYRTMVSSAGLLPTVGLGSALGK